MPFSRIHSSWYPLLQPVIPIINATLESISGDEIAPSLTDIFATFSAPLDDARVLLIGQDPYPSAGYAQGLAFSVNSKVSPLPKSLKNIFAEYQSDLGFQAPTHGDLSPWLASGVVLMNRVLTTRVGESNAHINRGWELVTTHIASELGRRGCVAILWGNQAQELQSYFESSISSPHPSPLSAYRGFFGSKPFSRTNKLLEVRGLEPVNWKLP